MRDPIKTLAENAVYAAELSGALNSAFDSGQVMIFGASQGAAVAPEIANKLGIANTATAMVEAPNARRYESDRLGLIERFIGGSGDFNTVIDESFEDENGQSVNAALREIIRANGRKHPEGKLAQAIWRMRNALTMSLFGLGMALPSNVSTTLEMAKNTAGRQIEQLLSGGGRVGFLYGENGIGDLGENRRIVNFWSENSKFVGFEQPGMKHAGTNDFQQSAELVKRILELPK